MWGATRTRDQQEVALKVSTARVNARLSREVMAMRLLGSPICPQFIEEGTTAGGLPYIAMQRIEGNSMAHWLASSKLRIPPIREATQLFSQLSQLVQATHDQGLLHRDLKPENTMVVPDGSMRLLDFGLARLIGAPHNDTRELSLTQTGAMLGTVAYIAPEQSLGRKSSGPAADIYSLAVIGFELLTGRLPFWGNRSSILQAHSWHKPPRASQFAELSTHIDEIIGRGLSKDPKKRWSSATEFARALADELTRVHESAPKTRVTPSHKGAARRDMALLSIEGSESLAVTSKLAASVGGHVARADTSCVVIVFPSAPSIKEGVTAAVALVLESFARADKCVIHVASLRARKGKRGIRVMGDALKHFTEWTQHFGPGLHATASAAPFVNHSQLARKTDGGHLVLRNRPVSMTPQTGQDINWDSMSVDVRFWGRKELLSSIEAKARESLAATTPCMTTVIGDTGSGKTQLARHVLSRVGAWETAGVLKHNGNAPLKRLVCEAFHLFDGDTSIADVEQACATRLSANLAPTATPVIALAIDVIDEAEFQKLSSLVGATARRQALARAISEALVHSARQRPLVILIDDAHLADFTTLDALEMATLDKRGVPLWVFALGTPTFLEARPNWGIRAAESQRHELGVLDRDAASGMLKQLLSPVEFIPESTLTSLIELTEGIPLHLEEVAQALKHNGAIRKREGTNSWFIASDELMLASKTPLGQRLAKASLAGLRQDVAQFAQLCAVMNAVLTADEIDLVQRAINPNLGFSALDPSVGLSHLADRKLLRRIDAVHFEFRHAIIRDALEEGISAALHRVLHGAALRVLPAQSTAPQRLARHAEKAGEAPLAASLYIEVATQAEDRFRYVEAEQAYSRALRNLEGNTKERAQALAGRARVHHFVGRHDDALADLGAAMCVATEKNDDKAVAEMLLEQATILDWKFQFIESAKAAKQAAAMAVLLGDEAIQLRSDLAIARTQVRQQEFELAIPSLKSTAQRARHLEDHTSIVISLALLGGALAAVSRLDEAKVCLDEMIAVSEEVGDRFHLAVAHGNRMLVWTARHDYEHAVEDAALAASIAGEIGSFPIIWISQHTQAELLLWLGRYDEAQRIADDARSLQHRFTTTPDPADTLLVARVKVANSDDPLVASEELSYIDTQHTFASLKPLHQRQTEMLQLWQNQDDADAWHALLADAKPVFEANEMLEFLLLYARAAYREHRGVDVDYAGTLALALTESGSHWISFFSALGYTESV